MDLLETRANGSRHPWERARARAVERIVRMSARRPITSILDWGCGDGFTGRYLLDRLGGSMLVGVDPHLTDAQRTSFAEGDDRIRYCREPDDLPIDKFDLVLLCDVIEHVADDVGLVEPLMRQFLAKDGCAVVTVPAFQALFSAHDFALKHYRRYHLSALESVLRRSGLDVLRSGYLFASLLPVRAASKLLSPRHPEETGREVEGAGAWRAGSFISSVAEAALSLDNSLLLGFSERGLRIPGLSAWASCEVRSS